MTADLLHELARVFDADGCAADVVESRRLFKIAAQVRAKAMRQQRTEGRQS